MHNAFFLAALPAQTHHFCTFEIPSHARSTKVPKSKFRDTPKADSPLVGLSRVPRATPAMAPHEWATCRCGVFCSVSNVAESSGFARGIHSNVKNTTFVAGTCSQRLTDTGWVQQWWFRIGIVAKTTPCRPATPRGHLPTQAVLVCL